MKTSVLVTGAAGFLGRNLCAHLRQRPDMILIEYDLDSSPEVLESALQGADVIFHLAGVNRPPSVEEFQTGNAGFTGELCGRLLAMKRKPAIVLSSSIQAELDNPYGVSKRGAEEALQAYCAASGAAGVVHRLKNLFGKWCRPNYNSVTATFCHNIAHDLPIQISDPAREVELTCVEDVVAAFLQRLPPAAAGSGFQFAPPLPARRITLGALADLIRMFRALRTTLVLPDFSDPFTRALYTTYLSYLETDNFAYALDIKADARGSLAEFLKSPAGGQIFLSRTLPGITRGNHYHHAKTEKFFVVQGSAVIRLRHIAGSAIVEYRVAGEEYRVVDIPPGYTHSIANTGDGELVTLFWTSEPFDPARPDTYFEAVDLAQARA